MFLDVSSILGIHGALKFRRLSSCRLVDIGGPVHGDKPVVDASCAMIPYLGQYFLNH